MKIASNWFSSIQAITVGIVIWLTAIGVRKQMADDHYKRKFCCWAGIGTFFIYLGIDDAIKFHERMGTAYHVLLFDDDGANEGVLGSLYDFLPSYTWQMVFALSLWLSVYLISGSYGSRSNHAGSGIGFLSV